jgi:curved DNA-binding protein CbpA
VQRFQQISESYSTLSDPQKRARYDRDVLRLHQQQRQNSRGAGAGAGQQGGTYAGSRAPTGLSKRRSAGIFRGPPPSYFAQGGGGAYQPGRNPYSRGPDGEAASSSNSNYTYNGNSNSDAYPGNGDGSGSFTADPQHDFDSSGVFRTQTHEDRKRNARRAAAMAAAQAAAEEDGDFWARFVIISCTLLGGLMIGSLLVGTGGGSGSGSGRKAGGMVRADGSRRDREREGQKG